jgi:hypothetical protein
MLPQPPDVDFFGLRSSRRQSLDRCLVQRRHTADMETKSENEESLRRSPNGNQCAPSGRTTEVCLLDTRGPNRCSAALSIRTSDLGN